MLTGTNTVKKAVAPALMLALTVMILIPCPAYTGDINAKEIVSLDYEDNRFDEAPPDIRRILERKKLIVAIYCDDKPPFVMADSDGVLQGFDIDIARRIAKLLGVDIEFNRDAKSYNEMADLLVKGKADIVICKFSRTFERAKKVRFSDPYIIFRQTLMINKKLAAKARVEEYPMNYLRTANVKIGARAGTSYVEYAREMFKKAKIVEDSWDNLTAAVVRGDLFGVIRDEYEILKFIKKNPDLALYISVYILKDKKDYIAMAVPPESVNLLAWINIFLESNEIMKDAQDIINDYPHVFGIEE